MRDIDTAPELTDPTEVFAAHRHLLVGVAYRVLGRVADAEDVVQEAWLRWRGVDHAEVGDPKAYLVRIVTRLAVDRLRLAQARRESYVGDWLPEPLLDANDPAAVGADTESISLAMLVVLETLSPLERVVFVLREAFHYSYAEIAAIVERSETAVRQLGSRARAHVRERRQRFDADHAVTRRVTERFVEACVGGDLAALLGMLAPQVTLRSDGGGRQKAPLRTILGADKVARFLVAIGQNPPAPDLTWTTESVNGAPALVVTRDGDPHSVFAVEQVDGVITRVYLLTNPDKLAGVRATR
ncbi:MAG TPA: RNA polymerase sigma-70 factor [Streptosporangiales bacterium]